MAIVTVMFTDIVGSTALLDRLGDDVYEGLRRSHFATLEAAVAEFGGQVVKNLGDGLMVVFDSAANAVACAVACQQAVARQGRRRPDAIAVRVGLDVGEPTVQDGDYFGTPVVTAKRLCDAADGGEILVSSLVRDLVVRHRSHSFRPGTERELKGFGEPVLAYGVEWTNEGTDDADLPVALVMADAAPFVGRDDEFTTLTQLWKEASTGRGRTALLGGEPGVGKSRLAAQLARRASDDNSSVLYGRCDEGLGVSYQPFVEALRGFVAGCDDLTLRELVGNRAGVLVAFLPELAERLGAVDAPALAEPEAERLRLFEAVADLLDRASRQLPLVVVLDDLHWATAPTLLLLRHVVRSSAQSALLVIGTYRHTEVDNVHGLADLLADLRRDASVTRILLRGLDQAELTQYLQSAAGHQLDADGQELASLLYTQTEGNPFFVGEMLAHLVETGALVNQDGQWTAAGANPSDLGLPEGVREVIGRRVARLSAGAQQMLTMASMVGARFSLRTVELALGSDNDEVIDHLEEAMAAGLLDESDEGYMFAHALIRQAIHDDVSTVRRARMHRRIGEALEALPLSDERVEALALHNREATAASDPTKALTYAVEAARRANRRFAFEEAAATLEAAVDLVDGDESVDPSLVAELLLELSHTKATMGDLTGGTDLAFAAADAARRAANSGQ
ncbi:MAG: hypothetical protein QOE28_3259, partial [Solirubrobacteraceae bacterium]|nr:hypothetical protein [Solirubrobacteraceae bacterium]